MEMRKLMGITRKFSNDRRKLNRALKKSGIEFKWDYLYDGYQWTFPKLPGDVAIHSGTYSAQHGYFESYQMPWDNGDVTILTCAEVVQHVSKGE